MSPIKRKVIQLDDHRPVRGSIQEILRQLEEIEFREKLTSRHFKKSELLWYAAAVSIIPMILLYALLLIK